MKPRLITVGSLLAGSDTISQLRLTGKWLKNLGFHPGEKVAVQEEEGRLTLQLVTREETSSPK
jgi:hypothetical protein